MANKFRQIVEAPSSFFQSLTNLVPWLSKLWRTLGQVEEWHEVGSTGEPAFANSWVNYGAGYDSAAFYKDPWGVVHIKGLIKSGTMSTAVFTLPSGYRPSLILIFPESSNSAFGDLYITAGGEVKPSTGSNIWFSINCSFRAQ